MIIIIIINTEDAGNHNIIKQEGEKMKKFKFLKLVATVVSSLLIITACSNTATNSGTNEDKSQGENLMVEITDIHGTIEVPVNPKNVVALDNRTFKTLEDWDIELAAVPKDIMPKEISYVSNESVLDIGNHREPNLEIIASVNPELVIVGQRFASYYEEIKALVPNAVVIDLNFDVSESANAPGENLVNGLNNSTIALGKIFDKNEEAEKLVADFDNSIEKAKTAYNGKDTVMAVIVSGGDVGFSAPGSGRVWGPMYEIFGWKPSLEIKDSSSNHQGDDISVEAIAKSNPDWLFVLDRDAQTNNSSDAVPAQDVIANSKALKNVTAVTEQNIVYAPSDTYTNESIQTYIKLFDDIANAFSK